MRGPAQTEPPTPPLPAIERGWQEYRDGVLARETDGHTLTLARLAWYAGTAHAVGLLLSNQPETWIDTVDQVASEVLDETDRLLLDSLVPASHLKLGEHQV